MAYKDPEKEKEYQKKYYKKWYEANKEHKKQKDKEWREANKEHTKQKSKKWYEANKEHKKQKRKEYYEANKEDTKQKSKEYQREKYKTDKIYRFNKNISSAIRKSLKKGKGGHHWEDLVGYTINELESHLKSTVTEEEWEEYINNPGSFHIDHIKPKSLFQFESYEDQEFKECWSLNNLQLLRAEENLSKGNKYEE